MWEEEKCQSFLLVRLFFLPSFQIGARIWPVVFLVENAARLLVIYFYHGVQRAPKNQLVTTEQPLLFPERNDIKKSMIGQYKISPRQGRRAPVSLIGIQFPLFYVSPSYTFQETKVIYTHHDFFQPLVETLQKSCFFFKSKRIKEQKTIQTCYYCC